MVHQIGAAREKPGRGVLVDERDGDGRVGGAHVLERSHEDAASVRLDDLPQCRENVGIGAASAEVAAHPFADLVVAQLGAAPMSGVTTLGAPSANSSNMPIAEQIWPGVQ